MTTMQNSWQSEQRTRNGRRSGYATADGSGPERNEDGIYSYGLEERSRTTVTERAFALRGQPMEHRLTSAPPPQSAEESFGAVRAGGASGDLEAGGGRVGVSNDGPLFGRMRQSSGGASSAAPSLLMHGGGGRVDSSNDLFTRDDEYLLGGGGRDGLTGGGVGRAGTALSESSSEGFILRPALGGATSGGGAGAGGRGSYNPSAVSEALLSGIGRGPIISSSSSSPSLQSLYVWS